MKDQEIDGSSTPHIPRSVISGAFALVRALTENDEPLPATALARATGIPRTSVIRLLHQLEAEGVVHRHDRCWTAHVRLFVRQARERAYPRAESLGVLRWLSDTTGGTVSLVRESEAGYTADLMAGGSDHVPIHARHGSWMPPDSAAAIALCNDRSGGASRTSVIAVDRERCLTGLTCIAVALNRGDDRAAFALQLATEPDNAADRHVGSLLRARKALAEVSG
jgi:IclR family acetate operon transcriptional repressor